MYKLNLLPQQSSYSVSDGIEIVRVDLQGGFGRYRRDVLKASKTVSVTWVEQAEGFKYLRTFYNTVVAQGSSRFLIDLIVDSPELVEHEAMFIPGTMQLAEVSGTTYKVTAQLEVMPVGDIYSNSLDYLSVVNEWGLDGWESALLDIHDSVVLIQEALA